VFTGGRADMPETIRAWCCDWHSCSSDESKRYRVIRHSYCYSVTSGRYFGCNRTFFTGQYHCQRPWPVYTCQFQCCIHNMRFIVSNTGQVIDRTEVYDQRILPGPSFYSINLVNCTGVGCICSQSIYGLSGEADQATIADDSCPLSYCSTIFH
jgi:hypothetical protein